MPPTPPTLFRLTPDELATLDAIAAEDRATRADVVRQLLRAEAARRAKRRPQTP